MRFLFLIIPFLFLMSCEEYVSERERIIKAMMMRTTEIYDDCVSYMANLPQEQRLIYVEGCNSMIVKVVQELQIDSTINNLKTETIIVENEVINTITETDTLRKTDTMIVEMIETKDGTVVKNTGGN